MSIDTLIEIRTSFPAEMARSLLVSEPALSDLHLIDDRTNSALYADDICLIVMPWKRTDCDLIENGFDHANVACTLIPGRGMPGRKAERRVIAALLRLIPGDVCLASQDAAGPDLLRLGDTIYVNPDGFVPEHLAEHGYTPPHLVIGIPQHPWWT